MGVYGCSEEVMRTQLVAPDRLLSVADWRFIYGSLSPNIREHFIRNPITLKQYQPSPPSAAARRIPYEGHLGDNGGLGTPLVKPRLR